MNAELIAVGTEILLGDIVNTDAQVISQGLSELGINVFYQTVVGDNPARLRHVEDHARRLQHRKLFLCQFHTSPPSRRFMPSNP